MKVNDAVFWGDCFGYGGVYRCEFVDSDGIGYIKPYLHFKKCLSDCKVVGRFAEKKFLWFTFYKFIPLDGAK